MDTLMHYISLPFGYLMQGCWAIVGNYGIAILLFTLATKFVLLPLSIWIQKNSILMVKIQPEVNFLKARLYGNMDAIADEQGKLFKREHYHPSLSVIPLILQLVLLLAVVRIIYHPLTYLFSFDGDTITALAQFIGADLSSSGYELEIINAIKSGQITSSTVIAGADPQVLSEIVLSVEDFGLDFLGMNLTVIPSEAVGLYLLVPFLAGLSSWALCFTQNLDNVLQHEQSALNKYGIMVISVALSLYLGIFVPSGIALYWIASNLMSIIQMYLLNVAINPKKHVDYEALEESRKALAQAKAFGDEDKKDENYKENRRREKEDYKRFKKVANKHVVFYSEKGGFYKYFKDLINELLARSNLNIHYVTNDPNDGIFKIAEENPRIKAYYIGLKKTSILMMMVSCKVFVMTTPDLDKYYLKRSFVDKNVEYIYVPHDMMSVHMSFREGAFDAFDTIFCTGNHVEKEMREIERVYNLKQKELVHFGYPLSDLLVEAGKKANEQKRTDGIKEILIAPSWQEDNLLDSCIDKLIEGIYSKDYKIIVRPHPEYVKRFGGQMKALTEKYKDYDSEHLVFELDFASNKSIYSSDLIITDWSGIAPEFCFATGRPALFVNTKMKCPNENYTKIPLTPIEISLRDEIGMSVNKEDLDTVGEKVRYLIENTEKYTPVINKKFDDMIYNHGSSAVKGAQYILMSLAKKEV